MGFRLLPSNFKQTAFNASATIVAAELAAGIHTDTESVDDRLKGLSGDIFKDLNKLVEKDNETLEEEEKKNPPRSSGGGKSFGGKKTTGSVESDGSMALRGGKFDGLTIAEVYKLSKDDAEEYGYNAPGRAYIKWIAENDDPRNSYKQARAAAFIDAKKASSGDEE